MKDSIACHMNCRRKFSIFLLVFTCVLPIQSVYQCDSDYVLFDKYCYRIPKDVELYENAIKVCHDEAAYLASVHNEAANNFIRSQASDDILIGLHYEEEWNTYNWSDGSKLDYTNYADGFESFKDYFGYCAKLESAGQWFNADCGAERLKYICRKPAVDVTISNSSVCPDGNKLYVDFGELASPGYPMLYDANSVLECTYKLMAKTGQFVNIRIEDAGLDSGDSISIYKTFSDTKANLVTKITHYSANVSLLVHTNLVMLVFSGVGTGKWKLRWDSVETKKTCEPIYRDWFTIYNNWCFVYLSSHSGRDAAYDNMYCMSAHAAILPSIHSQEEEDTLSSMLAYVPAFANQHIGLRYDADGEWRWLDNSPVDYKNFANGYSPAVSSSKACIFNTGGKWNNGDCSSSSVIREVICKKSVAIVPVASNYCPDPSAIYDNCGELSSPAYPDEYGGPGLFGCMAHLRAKTGYTIYAYFVIFSGNDQVLRVYNGWTPTDDHELGVVRDNLLLSTTNGTNKMLIAYDALLSSHWTVRWYSTKDPTFIPALRLSGEDRALYEKSDKWVPAVSAASPCPSALMGTYSTNKQFLITPPKHSSGYPANTDCIYYSNSTYNLPAKNTWRIDFVTLKIGSDDYVKLIDTRTNTVFATTDTNIREGLFLSVDFEFAIEFHSGSTYSEYDTWTITQHNPIE